MNGLRRERGRFARKVRSCLRIRFREEARGEKNEAQYQAHSLMSFAGSGSLGESLVIAVDTRSMDALLRQATSGIR